MSRRRAERRWVHRIVQAITRSSPTYRHCFPLLVVTAAFTSMAVIAGCATDVPTAAQPDALFDLLSPTSTDGTSGNSPGAKLCQKNGWTLLKRINASAFTSEGDCVSYVAIGGRFGQVITFTSSNPSPVMIGDPNYAVQAVASSGLPVTLSLDAASSGCGLSSTVVTFVSEGTCRIDGNQAGNDIWAPAFAQQSITVNRRNQTITFTSINPSPVHVGYPDYTVQATATSGLAVTFSLDAASSGCTLSAGVVHYTTAGICRVNANQAGNTVWAPAAQVQQAITVTVNPAQYCASIGGSFGGQTEIALWTCNGWRAESFEDAKAKVSPLVDACRVDNGITIGPLDFGTSEPYPTTVNARCHLPEN